MREANAPHTNMNDRRNGRLQIGILGMIQETADWFKFELVWIFLSYSLSAFNPRKSMDQFKT